MGRLFWKMFLAFWLSLVLAAGGVGVAVWLYKQVDPDDAPGGGPRGGFVIGTVASVLQHGGPEAAREMLRDWHARGPRTRVFVIDDRGEELLGRPPPHFHHDMPGVERDQREVVAPDGRRYRVQTLAPRRPPGGRRPPEHPSPLGPLAAGLLASVGFSVLMAWTLARPVRQLRSAFGSLAEGRLDTRVAGRMGGWRDEIVDLGQDFDHMANRLQALVGAQRRLLHDVSHELRSPLARLQAAIGLARQNPVRAEELMERVERESGRLDQLVGELLTLARLEAGSSDAPRERLDLFDLAAGVAGDAAFEAEARGVSVVFEGQGDAPLAGDGAQLQRAFENVMRNAVKFSPPGGRVEVAAARDDGTFRMQVSDAGPGVPVSDLDRIFEPFFRSEGSAAPGFGLGLAIARRAVAAHGGIIRAENRSPSGLTVRVELPLDPRP